MFEDFPWIKFTILTLAFGIPIFLMTPGLKWKLLYTLAVPIGVAIALGGKTLGGYGLNKRI